MKKVIFLVLTVLTLVLLFSLVTFAAGEEIYTIKHSYVSPELTYYQNFVTNYSTTFKGYVERMSQGRIKVENYPAAQLGGERESIEGVTLGTIEMATVADAPLSGFYKKAMVTSSPGVFASIEEANAIFKGPWGQAWFEELRKALGIKVINLYSYGFRNFSNNIRELRVPADTSGIKFRTMESPVYVDMVNSLGAVASPMPSSEMFTALQHGVVDGQENPISAVIQDKTYEVQEYYTLNGHTCSLEYVIMNDKFFSDLPADLQKIVLDGANRASQSATGLIYVNEENGLEFLSQHMKIYTPTSEEAKLWQEAVSASTIGYIREQIGDEIVDSLLDAIKEYREQ